MARTAAIIGQGTTLGYSAVTPTTYTTIGEVVNVGMPKVTYTDVDATHYESPDGIKEYIPGWGEPGEVPVTINYVKAQTTTLDSIVNVLKSWQITLPDSSTWTFVGFIKELGGEIPLDGKITITLVIRITGKPVFAAAS